MKWCTGTIWRCFEEAGPVAQPPAESTEPRAESNRKRGLQQSDLAEALAFKSYLFRCAMSCLLWMPSALGIKTPIKTPSLF